MKKICSWCNKLLKAAGSEDQLNPITHGICPDCVRDVLSFKALLMANYLDRFSGPVYMLNDECEIITANQEGAIMLGKDIDDLSGNLIGEAFECEHAISGEGCGKSVHCRTCAIRRSVLYTMETGNSNIRVPAHPDLHWVTGEKDIKYYITSEKVGDAVFLKVEEKESEKGFSVIP